MIFHIAFDYPPDARADVHDRFKRTGAPPPQGVNMIGRWHAADGNHGWLICESEDPDGIPRWLQERTDPVSFEVTPVLTDEQFAAVID